MSSHYQATVEHCEQLTAIDRESYPDRPLSVNSLRKWLGGASRAAVLSLGTDGRLRGFALVERTGPAELELVRLAVAVGERGQGVARGLVERLGEAGRLVAWLREDNRPGLEVAKRLGFRAERVERCWRGDLAGVVLGRPKRD